jgi:hypothetical protein
VNFRGKLYRRHRAAFLAETVMSADTPVIIDSATSGDYGTYYPSTGPYFAELVVREEG